MARAYVVFASSCVVVLCFSIVLVLLVPQDGRHSSSHLYWYKISDGLVTWTDGNSVVKVTIDSSARKQTCSHEGIACYGAIEFLSDKSVGDVECYETSSSVTISEADPPAHDEMVEDCIYLRSPETPNVYWYGGGELYAQKWPINNISKEIADIFLSTDLPGRYGNVLERYWLSSSGVAVLVHPEVPLFVSHIANEKICLRAHYNETVFLGRQYSRNQNDTYRRTELKYYLCLSERALSTHTAMIKPNEGSAVGFLDRPRGLPDTRMLQHPIWSTWARYKQNINQSIVEEYAEEILQRNFSNSQLEIDDGYEAIYGDFTFDEVKFPKAKSMIDTLHNKGFRVTIWVTPFINTRSKNYFSGRSNGYFIRETVTDKNPARIIWWNGVGAAVDFTNDDAAAWYEAILSEVREAYALDSFKFDAGETNYMSKNGFTLKSLSNPGKYTTLYANSAFNVGGNMMEMRSSWRTQPFPFYMRMMDKGSRWGGFKGLQTLIPTALTFGIIGYPFVLPDMVGGNAYGGLKPDRELYIRWLEITAFMPVIQFSITPWDYDEEVSEIGRYYSLLHSSVVFDEVLRVSKQYVYNSGMFLPVSPIWYLADSTEIDAYKVNDEFLVGERYLIAPIIKKGARKRDIYLPRGSDQKPIIWRDMLRRNQSLEGGSWLHSYRIDLEEISWWEKV